MRIIDYIKDTKAELKHVSWPTQKQTIQFTLLVIAVSLFVAAFTSAFDALFSIILETFVLR